MRWRRDWRMQMLLDQWHPLTTGRTWRAWWFGAEQLLLCSLMAPTSLRYAVRWALPSTTPPRRWPPEAELDYTRYKLCLINPGLCQTAPCSSTPSCTLCVVIACLTRMHTCNCFAWPAGCWYCFSEEMHVFAGCGKTNVFVGAW